MPSRSGQVRIIAGAWRSRRLTVPSRPGLRPTPDAVRETLFNWIADKTEGAHCLDLFAGSGALGFEAASRGATKVVMVEHDRQAVTSLRDNCQRLDANQIAICKSDACQFLTNHGHNSRGESRFAALSFDVVFIDPPFQQGLIQPVLDLLNQNQWLAPDAVVYIERAHTDPEPKTPPHWHQRRFKRVGHSDVQLFDCG